jgi:multiple sugar transport system substrate-binding protein
MTVANTSQVWAVESGHVMRSKRGASVLVVSVVVAVMALAGCSSGGDEESPAGPAQSATTPITVLVDETRRAPAEQWAKAHPSPAITVQVADNSQGAIPAKIALAKKSGEKLPDVVFLSQPDELSTLAANPVNYPLDLTGAAGATTLGAFAKGSVDRCTFQGKVYCLPNDIGQTVLYYNKTLFRQWGYSVPTTFEQWRSLGERVAKEHPGYSLGSVSGRYGTDGYYGSSGCPLNASSSPTEVKINVEDPACARVNAVIGPMMANGSLSTLDPFDTSYVKTVASGKLLAAVAPSWFGAYGIKPNYKKAGDYAVAPMPVWSGASEAYSGAVGGGLWLVSASSPNVKAATDFVVAMTTDEKILVAGATYPASTAGATAWLRATSADPWYAQDPAPVYVAQAGKINPSLGYVRYQTQLLDAFNSTVIAGKGKDIDGALKVFGQRITQAAEATGYSVSK